MPELITLPNAPDWHQDVFDQHVTHETRARAFSFKRAKADLKVTTLAEPTQSLPDFRLHHVVEGASFYHESTYHFTLTWIPGYLVLTGDFGELTLTHHAALSRFEAAIDWAATSDYDYLLGKSSVQREYDSNATLQEIVRWANEEAIECLNGRGVFYYGQSATDSIRRRVPGLRQELQIWRRELRDAKADGSPDEKLPDRPDQYGGTDQVWSELESPLSTYDVSSRFDVPDAWRRWAAIWEASDVDIEPFNVTVASGRRELKADLGQHIQTSESASRFFSLIGCVDYYGEYSWSSNALLKIRAIIWGAHQIRAVLAQTTS